MRDQAAPGQPGYPGCVERVYARLRRHPWLPDGVLAILLLAGSAHLASSAVPVSLALAGTVAVRRRFPVAACCVALAIAAVQVAVAIGPTFTNSPLQPTFTDTGILVLIYTVATCRPRRVSLPVMAVGVSLAAAAITRWNPGPEHGARPAGFIFVIGIFALTPVSAWVLGDSIAYRRAYSAALEERAVRAERERDTQAQIAAAAERGRIAREMHDVIAHNLSVIVAQADGGTYAFDGAPEKSRQALAQIGRTGRQALSEMSSLLGVLRAGPEEPLLAPAPAAADIANLVAQAREAGMRVSHTVDGAARPLPGGLSLAAYRIAQEALTNVRKHAGAEAAAAVTVRYGPEELLVSVADDGRGDGGRPVSLPRYGDQAAHPEAREGGAGHGLTGMRERAALYGGTVQAGPRPGGGFEVTARLPLAPAVRTASSPPATPSLGAV
jgi:signal transduction histidine kinase